MKGDDYSRIIAINAHPFYERDNKDLRDALIAIVDKYQVRATPYTWTGDSSHFIYEITYGLKHLILVDEGKHIMYRSDKNGFYEIIHGDDSSIDFSNLYLNNSKLGALYTDINGNNSYNSRNDQNSKTILRPSVNRYYSISDRGTYVLLNDGIFSGRLSAEAAVIVSQDTRQWDLNCLVSFDSIS